MDSAAGGFTVHFTFTGGPASVHLGAAEIRGRHSQQSLVHRWHICLNYHTYIFMEYCPASGALHSARASETNYQNIMDGPNLQSGQLDCFKIPEHSHLCGHMQRVL